MAEGIAFSFLGKLSEYLVAPIGRQFGYVFCYNGNIEKMRRKVEDLEAKSCRVKLLVEAGNNNCEVIGPDVDQWLKRVEEKMEEANLILLDKQKVGKGCLNEWCLHFKSRYSVSRKATKRTQDLVDLIDAGIEVPLMYSSSRRTNFASFTELKQLSNLVAIDICIPYKFLPIDLNFENLEKIKISVRSDEEVDWEGKIKEMSQNTLDLVGDEIAPLKCLLKALCRKTEILVVAVKDLKNLCNEVERKDLSRLKFLFLDSCDELVSVFDDGMNQSSSIHSSSLVLPTFGNLRTLLLRGCSKLKCIFSLSIARGLINLETLVVYDCLGIEEIISKERGDDDQDEKKAVEFLSLKKIKLEDLPNLVSFCEAVDQVLKFPQLKKMKLNKLPKLTSIFPEKKTSSSSDGHHAYAASSSSSTNHPLFHQKVTLTNLEDLQVYEMKNMTTVFPENVIPQLQSLKAVVVIDCKSVEVVFDLQGSNLNEGHHQVFSHFQRITLYRLPKLTSVWKLCPRVVPGFQNLKLLGVQDCDSLRHLFTPSMAKTLVTLEYLFVNTCEILEAIVAAEEGEEDEKEFTTEEAILFPKLTVLDLEKLPSLLTILPKHYSFNWSSLKDITLEEEKIHLLRRPDQVSV